MIRRCFNWLFLDKNGTIVVAQFPNIPIFLWLASMVANYFIPDDIVSSILTIIGTVALSIWAGLELFSGVNNFRRILGTCVLLYIGISILL